MKGWHFGDWHFAWRGWLLGALLATVAWARWNSAAPLHPGWLVLVVVGSAWRWQAGRYIQSHSNALAFAGPVLAAHGPYRLGRHPLYLSNLAVIAGLVLFAHCLPHWAEAVCLLAAAAHHALLARSEEAYLASLGGEAYRRYMEATPRWIGRPRSLLNTTDAIDATGATGAAGAAAAWRRQGANITKACACVALLWLLAAFPR